MNEAIDLRAREAALLLHGLGAEQREAVLARLDPVHRETLRPLLGELVELGIPASLARDAARGHGTGGSAARGGPSVEGAPIREGVTPESLVPGIRGWIGRTGRSREGRWSLDRLRGAVRRRSGRGMSRGGGGRPGEAAPWPDARRAVPVLRGCAAPTVAALLRDAELPWREAVLRGLERDRRREVAELLASDDALPPRLAAALRERLWQEALQPAAGRGTSQRRETGGWTRWLRWTA